MDEPSAGMILGMAGDASAMFRGGWGEDPSAGAAFGALAMFAPKCLGKGQQCGGLFERVDFSKPVDQRILDSFDKEVGDDFLTMVCLDGYSDLLYSLGIPFLKQIPCRGKKLREFIEFMTLQ